MTVAAERNSFGLMPDGREVARVRLARAGGVSATVISFGATLQALELPDQHGVRADICIGHDRLGDYLAQRNFFGVTIGRVANRIARGRFRFDGREHETPANNGVNSLHGGTHGFDTVLWELLEVTSGDAASVTLRYVSPAGEMGYPGTLTTTATYTLDALDQLTIDYRATTDAPTLVNLTNHALWNLGGAGIPQAATAHELTIAADRFTPIDETAIPIGTLDPVGGTPFDFRTPTKIDARLRGGDQQLRFGHGYDHNWVVADAATETPHRMARLSDPISGRSFDLSSNQPGIQFYSGNFFDGTTRAKGGTLLRRGDAIALEPQGFPDAPNQPGFPSIRLDPGEIYRNIIIYKFASGEA